MGAERPTERVRRQSIQLSMKATIETHREDLALLEEYRVALHNWDAAREAESSGSQPLTLLEATKRVEEIERKLKERQIEYAP